MTEQELPPGWAWSTLGEVAEVNPATDLSALADDSAISFVPMASVEEESGRLDPTQTRQFLELKRKSLTKFQEGDLLFAKITPCMENGKIALATGLVGGLGFGSTEFHVIRPMAGISARYLLNYLLQKSVRIEAERNMVGAVGQRRVPREYLRELRIPVPPLLEQERIVDALEGYLSRFAKSDEALELSEIRGVLLERTILRTVIPDPIPRSWKVVRVDQAGEVDLGRQRHPDWHSGPEMRPYLRVANVFEDRLDLTDVMEMDFSGVFERYKLEAGDILLNEGQSPHLVGRPAMYRGNPPEVAFTKSLLRFRAGDEVDPEWALLVFRRHLHARRFMQEVRVTTNIAHLSRARFRAVEFPIPPREEQARIVAKTESHLSDVKALEASVKQARAHAAVLRKSLLQHAFCGRLIAQDPSDEPASDLLERIRTEQAAQSKLKRGRAFKKAPAASARPAPPASSDPAGTFVQEELGL